MDLSSTHITRVTFPDGTRVRFTCDDGYEPVEGTGTIICTAGSWSSLTLKCDCEYYPFLSYLFIFFLTNTMSSHGTLTGHKLTLTAHFS